MAISETLIALKDSIKAVIFPNTVEAIEAKFHQPMLTDMAESLWRRGCDKTVYDETSTYMSLKGNRMVCGNQVVIDFAMTCTDNSTSGGTPYAPDSITITDLIPQNYEEFRWFKLEEVTIMVDDLALNPGTESWGSMEFNDLSCTIYCVYCYAQVITRLVISYCIYYISSHIV